MAKKTAAPKKVVKPKTVNDTYENMKLTVENMAMDVSKFEAGNNASGTRLRKAAQELKKLCQSFRGEVVEIRNARKS